MKYLCLVYSEEALMATVVGSIEVRPVRELAGRPKR